MSNIPKFKIITGPITTQWAYEWQPRSEHHFEEIDMNWDNAQARYEMFQMLQGFGILYVVQQTDQPLRYVTEPNGTRWPIHLYRIGFAFDPWDKVLHQDNVKIRQPMFKFHTACLAIRLNLKRNGEGYAKAREDLGPGCIECVSWMMAAAVQETYDLLRNFQSENISNQLLQYGFDYDTFCLNKFTAISNQQS